MGLCGHSAELQIETSNKGTEVSTEIPHKYREEGM